MNKHRVHLGWSLVHNCIIHPLMVVADLFERRRGLWWWWCAFLGNLHDWTGDRAYPSGEHLEDKK